MLVQLDALRDGTQDPERAEDFSNVTWQASGDSGQPLLPPHQGP